ncbi:MAG: hypothetical protein WAO24_10230 [Peptococcia bacterium]
MIKNKLRIFVLLLLTTLVVLLLGCSKDGSEHSFGASCKVYLKDLPLEYELLSKDIRNNIEISTVLRNVSTGKKFSFKLTEKNNFQQTLDLIPGTYDVHSVFISNPALAIFNVDTKLSSVKIVKNSQLELPLFITNHSDFIKTMENNKPTDEILGEEIFSRKVQFNGQIIELNSIKKMLKFKATVDKQLAAAETAYIPSTSHEGVALVVQNQTNHHLSINDATFIGVHFSKNNVVLPKGITLGMNISTISHSQKGILGTPDYFLGTPLIGTGFNDTTLVYLDKNSGDRISFHVNPNDLHVSSITYEFEKYE